MNKCTFIHNLDVSSTHMDEGGSYTVVKIVPAIILIIEKKIIGREMNLNSQMYLCIGRGGVSSEWVLLLQHLLACYYRGI